MGVLRQIIPNWLPAVEKIEDGHLITFLQIKDKSITFCFKIKRARRRFHFIIVFVLNKFEIKFCNCFCTHLIWNIFSVQISNKSWAFVQVSQFRKYFWKTRRVSRKHCGSATRQFANISHSNILPKYFDQNISPKYIAKISQPKYLAQIFCQFQTGLVDYERPEESLLVHIWVNGRSFCQISKSRKHFAKISGLYILPKYLVKILLPKYLDQIFFHPCLESILSKYPGQRPDG